MNRHGDDWLAELKKADSALPKDDFTFTDGSTMGLDSFHFDGLDNKGVEEAARLPETHGLSDLPDGSVPDPTASLDEVELMADDDGEGLYLDDMLSEGEGAVYDKEGTSLADLDWLDPTQKQKANRLPDNGATLDHIPELETAWGVNERTDGVNLIPNKDKDIADYEQSLREGPESQLPGNRNANIIRSAMYGAIRQSHFGRDLKAIQGDLERMLGADFSRVAATWDLIEKEHGLAGKVFIRAAAFPGLRNGKWAKELRKKCRLARYVITDDTEVANKLKMKPVASIPWKAALRYYAPRMKAAGHQVPTEGNPRTILKSFFMATSPAAKAAEGYKPVEKVNVQAQRVQGNPAKPVEGPVVSSEKQATKRKRLLALAKIARWVTDKKLTKKQAHKLRDANLSPEALLKRAASVVAHTTPGAAYGGEGTKTKFVTPEVPREAVEAQQAKIRETRMRRVRASLERIVEANLLTAEEAKRILKRGGTIADMEQVIAAAVSMAGDMRQEVIRSSPTSVYEGVGTRVHAHSMEVPHEAASVQEARLERGRLQRTRVALAKLVKAKLLTTQEGKRILKLGKTAKDLGRIIAAAVAVAGERRTVVIAPTPVKEFDGPILKAAQEQRPATPDLPPQEKALLRLAKATGFKAVEFKKLARWTRREMTKGLAGTELDHLLSGRFSKPLLKAASELLASVRSEHEGLSGFVYVDAAAYASPEGTKGCDKGAARHRATPVKAVLAMDRCEGCALANADGVCSNYNKELVASAPVENPKIYQKKAIAAADAPDYENTAAMFNPQEFGLDNESLDDIGLDGPPAAELGGVLFGDGMEID